LKEVIGVELSQSRFLLAEMAMMELSKSQRKCYELRGSKSSVVLTERDKWVQSRSLEFRHGSLFDCQEAKQADIVICETKIPAYMTVQLCEYLATLKSGTKLLTYENLEMRWNLSQKFPFERLKVNTPDDRFLTSWSAELGHHFHLWKRR